MSDLKNDLHSMPPGNPYSHLSNQDSDDDDNLTQRHVQDILTSYLPKSSLARDRNAINNIASEFIAQVNALTPTQKTFVKRKLMDMQPEGGMLLEAARTTADTIKIRLEKLLSEAKQVIK